MEESLIDGSGGEMNQDEKLLLDAILNWGNTRQLIIFLKELSSRREREEEK